MKTTAISKTYGVGTHTFPHNQHRPYMMLVAGSGNTTIAFGGGDPVPVVGFIEPYHVPISELVVVTNGSCHLITDATTHASVVTT